MLKIEDLQELAARHQAGLSAKVSEFQIGRKLFAFNATPYTMGVVNLSPDSWYRESVCLNADSAIERGRVLQAQGADLVDVGAESTLAHAARVNDSGQSGALLPVVRGLKSAGIPVSVETYSLPVARACLEAGADVLNLTGTEHTPEIFRMAADHDAAVIICFVQGANVRAVADFDFTADPVAMMQGYFARQIELALRAGLKKILIDPGLGFYYRNLQDSSVRIRHQMTVFLNTFRLRSLGYPVCHALPHAFENFGEEVRSAEPFFAVLATLGKTDLLRTHEVPKIRAVLKTMGMW